MAGAHPRRTLQLLQRKISGYFVEQSFILVETWLLYCNRISAPSAAGTNFDFDPNEDLEYKNSWH